MKIKTGDRILIGFVACLMIILALFLVLCAVGILNIAMVSDLVTTISANWINKVILAAVAAAIMILGICLMSAAASHASNNENKYLLLRQSDKGGVYVSFDTVRTIAASVAEGKNEVLRNNLKVEGAQSGVKICVTVAVKPDTIIPDFTATLQKEIKDTVEQTVGMSVEEVRIIVDNSTHVTKV